LYITKVKDDCNSYAHPKRRALKKQLEIMGMKKEEQERLLNSKRKQNPFKLIH